MAKFLQGLYKVKHKEKYVGDINNVVYRSSWELTYLFKLDMDDNVLEFSSEETVIPYVGADGKVHRYFVDFKVKRRVNDTIVTELIEIKPYKETIPPVLTEGKKTKTKIREIMTWDKKCRKWKQARIYCAKEGWIFRIITEKELPGVGR